MLDTDPISFLAEEAPGFAVDGGQVRVILDPSRFHEELCERARSAKRRVILATLYVGTGPKEHRLVESVRHSLKETDGGVQVNVLMDHCRGNRMVKGKSSCTVLLPLVREFGESCKVFCYHTPSLRGLWKKLAPPKLNETFGSQHFKVYVFDDSLIVSGANLSNDYFTDRQDRYVLVEGCPRLADFYEQLVKTVSRISLRLRPADGGFAFEADPTFDGGHPYLGDFRTFVDAANRLVVDFLRRQTEGNRLRFVDGGFEGGGGGDTWIFPSVQMGQLGVVHDSALTSKLLRKVCGVAGSRLKFSSGYFNLTEEYARSILGSAGSVDVVLAHPKANSFYGARFPLYGVVCAYTHFAKRFHAAANDRVAMFEYERPGWTFHCKGLWWYAPNASAPTATMVGSPNFGYRSVESDLETQLTIVTRNARLRRSLHEEQERLFEASSRVTGDTFAKPDRHVPAWVKLCAAAFRRLL